MIGNNKKKGGYCCATLLALLLLSACNGIHIPTPATTPVERETVLSRTSSLSHVYVLDRDTEFVTCAEPPPDTAYDHIDDSDFSLSLIQFGNDGGGGSEGSEEAEMIGRTPGVLIARELFFRTCEFSRNYNLNKDEALALYRDTLTTVKAGWAIEGANTTVRIQESEEYTINQTIPGVITGSHSSKSNAASTAAAALGKPHTTTTHRAPSGHTSTTHQYPSGHSTTIHKSPSSGHVTSTPTIIPPPPIPPVIKKKN